MKQLRKFKAGFTLVELVVTMAIAAIVAVAFAGVFTVGFKTFNSATQQSDAQNLAVLTVQKIQTEVRTCSTLKFYSSPQSAGTYYDASAYGLHTGTGEYLAGAFKKYNTTLTFTYSKTAAPNQLTIAITISSSTGGTLYSGSTNVYLMNTPAVSDPDDTYSCIVVS